MSEFYATQGVTVSKFKRTLFSWQHHFPIFLLKEINWQIHILNGSHDSQIFSVKILQQFSVYRWCSVSGGLLKYVV